MTRAKSTVKTNEPLSIAVQIVTAALSEIAQGTLPHPIELPKDGDLPALEMAFNAALASIQEQRTPKNAGSKLLASAQSFVSLLSESQTNADKIGELKLNLSSGLDGVESAGAVLDETLKEVIKATERSGQNVASIAVSTEEMTSTVAEIAQSAEQARGVANNAVRSVNTASHRVDSLGKAAKQISNVTETIVEIAEQTKLLALNATIEAARAGEAGKGFAVVANEVKELAQQTNSATSDIREKISAIQEATQGTIEEINGITRVIAEVSDYVAAIATATEEQSVTTREITEMITTASTEMNDVGRSARETGSAVEQMTIFIKEVHGYAQGIENPLDTLKSLHDSLTAKSNELLQALQD
ncbi:MAG: hypothetical protein JXR76_31315 [Deltaproteobacteria bacterium]|nr:hypothetical protein [Deltaproteobacteria bacterium]